VPVKSKLPLLLALFLPLSALAQGGNSTDDKPPAREIPFETIQWSAKGDERVGEAGQKALALNAGEWKHSRTEHFIVHFRRQTEARRVARQIEFDLWFAAKALGFKKADYAGQSHVYIFEGEGEWKSFLNKVGMPSWTAAFAAGDELFLNVRGDSSNAESQIAHETTHAVIARLYPEQRWPLWLNEGMAEYMSSASVAARRGKFVGRLQNEFPVLMPLEELVTLERYPQDTIKVAALYYTGEALVRYLHDAHGEEKFREFIKVMMTGTPLQEAILKVYPNDYKDWDAFQAAYRAKISK
jgi:hypothetical protein